MAYSTKICFLLVTVTNLVTSSTDAASCQIEQKDHFFNYTGFCFRDQSIPDNFPPNLTTLLLGMPNGSENVNYMNCSGSGQMSFLPAGKKPVSGITDLGRILFCHFNFDNAHAERISPYLVHVKSTLVTLQIQYGRLTRLNAGILRGLTNLKELEISDTGLEYVEPGAFNEIPLNGPALFLGYLSLSNNRLKIFDWALLQPMASGLEDLRLKGNGMESMHSSRPVFFPNLKTVDISTNNLTSLPAIILESWPRNLWKVNTLGNPFCPADSLCRCCSVRSLWEYAVQQGIGMAMTCGPHYKDEEDCPVGGNATISQRNATCSTDCSIVTMAMANLSHYERCTASAVPHAMACDIE